MNMTYLSLDKCIMHVNSFENANAYIDYWLNGNVSFMRFLLKPHTYIWRSLKIPDPHIFSPMITSYPLADSFEYFLCQQMAPTAQLYSWHITKACLQTIKNSKLPAKGYDRIIPDKTRQS